MRQSTALPVCCGFTVGEAQRRAVALGEAGARLLSMGVIGTPADVAARAGELAGAGVDTLYFHIYDGADTDHIRLLGAEVLPRMT